jgi:hypothetical protein
LETTQRICVIWLYSCSWLRQFTTTWKVIDKFQLGSCFLQLDLSIHTVALGSTQPLTEICTRHIAWGGKGSGCEGLKTLPPSCADCLKILGTPTYWSQKGLYKDSFTITLVGKIIQYWTHWWWWAIRGARFPSLVLNKCQIVSVNCIKNDLHL